MTKYGPWTPHQSMFVCPKRPWPWMPAPSEAGKLVAKRRAQATVVVAQKIRRWNGGEMVIFNGQAMLIDVAEVLWYWFETDPFFQSEGTENRGWFRPPHIVGTGAWATTQLHKKGSQSPMFLARFPSHIISIQFDPLGSFYFPFQGGFRGLTASPFGRKVVDFNMFFPSQRWCWFSDQREHLRFIRKDFGPRSFSKHFGEQLQ